ncbi:MAG: hypothetical protein AUJ28_00245 [Parcubacteria group bacterium CG1_02_37_51]|nr:MAG: hypothetical protein AUJ28_00245 [Parcubacteria group bacterium CG1_02_37_51]
MTILITGGAGFIGFHVAQKLLDQGNNIIIVDNFNSFYDPQLKINRIKKLASVYKNLRVIKADIEDFSMMEKIFNKFKIDKVCHLAAHSGVRDFMDNIFIYQTTNSHGTHNVFEAARCANVKDIVFASTAGVYNDSTEPARETNKEDKPNSLYAASKRANEHLAYTYHKLFGMKFTGLRFFNAYGPWGRPDSALFLFTKKIVNDEPIDVYNNGNMYRDFTYVEDIVQGVVAALKKSCAYEIINLARGETVKLTDYISEIEKNLGKRATKHMMPLQLGDPINSFADISKAKKLLNFQPKTSVKKGIKKFVDWYLDYYNVDM